MVAIQADKPKYFQIYGMINLDRFFVLEPCTAEHFSSIDSQELTSKYSEIFNYSCLPLNKTFEV